MVSPEVLTDSSLNHNHADNTSKETVDTNIQVDHSNTNIRITEGVKQPSYLNLACCISGYTTLTTYNSKQREGFRSRDISPARITGISLHSTDDGRNPPLFTSACGNFLSPQSRYLTDMDHRKKSGDTVKNGNSSADKVPFSTFTSSSSTSITNKSGSSSVHHQETSTNLATGGSASSQSSSFILQRVERLYGRGALAQGFYARRPQSAPTPCTSTPEKEKVDDVDQEACKESALPVLRLLRPEFRAQLTVAKRKSSSPVCSPNRPSDSTDGAVERIIPITIEANDEKSNSKKIEERETANKICEKDGHLYLKLVVDEIGRLETLAASLEAEVSAVPEHMEGRLRVAAGKARLLASQKLAQFKGLCHKNIVQDPSEDFPTTCEDLAGFWDMVSIQVTGIHEEFNKIDCLRKDGWPEQEANGDDGAKKEAASNGSNAGRRSKSAQVPPKTAVSKSSASKARDEARKKMLAERRKEMRKNANSTEDIVLL